MKKFLAMVTAAAFLVLAAEEAPWAKFFTDPSIPLEQSDWEGKKKTKVPEEEYQRDEEPSDDRQEQANREEKKQEKRNYRRQKKKQSKASSDMRDKFGLGIKIGYNLIPETKYELNNSGYKYDLFGSGSSDYSIDINMEFIGNLLAGHLGVGLGVGMTLHAGDTEYDDYNALLMVPVYAILKGYLFKGSTPFVSVGLGYNVYTLFSSSNESFEETTKNGGGLYASFSAGFIFKGGFQIEITYAMIKGKVSYEYYDSSSYNYYENDMDISHSHLTLGISYFF